MHEKAALRVLKFSSDNLKPVLSAVEGSKNCNEPRRRMQNPKWVGIFAIVLAFGFGGVEAAAQQPGKIFRIGYLDNGTASGIAVSLEAFRQELSKLGWTEGKNITVEYRFAEQKNERL